MERSYRSHRAGLFILLALLTAPAWPDAAATGGRGIDPQSEHGLLTSAPTAAPAPDAAPDTGLRLKLARELGGAGAPAGQVLALSPTLVAVLVAILLFVAGSIALLLLLSLVARIWRERGERRRERFRARWEPVLHARMAGEALPLPQLAPAERLLFLDLWLHLLGYVRDRAAADLVQTAQELGLQHYVLQLLQHRRPWKRLVAMRAAAALHLEQAGDKLYAKAMQNRPRSSLAAVHALLQIDPERGFAALGHVLQHQDWSPGAMVGIVQAGGPRTMHRLAALVRTSAPGRAKQLARLIELVEDQTALPALRERLASSIDAEEIAAILHCLGRLGQAEDRDRALTLLEHGSWLVRMQAAHALGALGLAEDAGRLAPLLRDGQWWVRYRAARSLLQLAGSAALAALRDAEPDRYARDMLDCVLAEGR